MKKTILLLFYSFLLSCNSIKKHNEAVANVIQPEQLKKDVDFAYNKIKKLQPQIYLYITKKKLDYKFDSLKNSIKNPMTTFDFYENLVQVVNSIKQGHMSMSPGQKIYSKDEIKLQKNKGISPLDQFTYKVFEDRLFINKNKSKDTTLVHGTEIIEIDGQSVKDLIPKFKKLITSDGYNTTFHDKYLGWRFKSYFHYYIKYKDSLKIKFVQNNQETEKYIAYKKTKLHTVKLTREQQKNKRKRNSIYGYDAIGDKFNRELSFFDKDSTIAKIDINGFSIGDYKSFYDMVFDKIQKKNVQNLIIDLRENGGGRLDEIHYLYKYLCLEDEFTFLNKSEVVSRTSIFHAPYWQGGSAWLIPLKAIGSPFYYGINYFSVSKENEKFYYTHNSSKKKKSFENRYKGKIYVLIDGGSFSASSIISSNLKSTKRAIFVGEETGGEYNGTAAGRLPVIKLPHSKVSIRIGLMYVNAVSKTEKNGHGIYPDIEIKTTIEDFQKDIDPQMNYILKEIGFKNEKTSLD